MFSVLKVFYIQQEKIQSHQNNVSQLSLTQ